MMLSALGSVFLWQLVIYCRALSPVQSLGPSWVKQPHPIEDLLQLTTTISRKKPGSLQYQKTWITWSTLAIEHIRYDLSQNLPHPVNRAATRVLEHELALVGDTGIVTPLLFANPGSRSGYALDFFGRVRRLADTVLLFRQQQSEQQQQLPNDETVAANAIQNALLQLLSNSENGGGDGSRDVCRVTSIGGGPGYDYVGLCLVASFLNCRTDSSVSSIQATVFDYEVGWGDLVDSMHQSANRILRQLNFEGHSCTFGGGCDIIKGMDDAVNHVFRDAVKATNIFVCQYCIAENAVGLRESDFIFFRDLFDRANDGAIFVFTETTHRLWPDVIGQLVGGFEVAFVKNRSFQLLVRKRGGADIGHEVREQCASILQNVTLHSVKRKAGYIRQTKEEFRRTS